MLRTVLLIRFRSYPELFAGFESGISNFGSGSDKLQFLVTKSAEHPLVTLNFIIRKKISQLDFKNLFFRI